MILSKAREVFQGQHPYQHRKSTKDSLARPNNECSYDLSLLASLLQLALVIGTLRHLQSQDPAF